MAVVSLCGIRTYPKRSQHYGNQRPPLIARSLLLHLPAAQTAARQARAKRPPARVALGGGPGANSSARPSAMRCCTSAAQMFNERGFHATSLDDIAARLNVTKPTLYYYVKNKDEILLDCVKKGLHMTLEGIEASAPPGATPLTSCAPACGLMPTSSPSRLACA